MSYRNYPDNIPHKIRRKPKRKTKGFKLIKLPPVNRNLLIVVLMLALLGIIAIFSASAPEGVDHYANPLYYPINHLKFAVVGFFLMFLTSRIHFKNWERWVMPVSIVTISLIVATLIPGLGKTSYGSSRWLTFLPIQPSEFGKFACVLLMASSLYKAKNVMDKKVLKHLMLIGIMMLVILLQPNMSIFMLLFITCLAMLAAAGMNLKIFITTALAIAPVFLFMIMSTPYQRKRVMGWIDPFSDPQGIGYNIIQSWYAISGGGFFGVGIGNSKQKLYYLPFGHTDFIFSVIAEELGFIGITVLVTLFLLFITLGLKIATRCQDQFGRLLAFGITFIIGVQAFINMCVASGVFPVTGVTLPLISYGGSSFIVTTAMIGILLNISRYSVKIERKKFNNAKIEKQPKS